jgi:hypothetical protein
LSINQTKLSGQCGRLKCCLNYELDTYLDALQNFPNNADVLEIQRSRAYLVKKDIFKDLMWYTLPDSNTQYPLTLRRVKEILQMNANGERPENLEAVELVGKVKEVEQGFVDVVGQISLRSLERNDRKRKDKRKNDNSARNNNSESRNQPQSSPSSNKKATHNRPANSEQKRENSSNNNRSRNNPRNGNNNRTAKPPLGNNPHNPPEQKR